MLLQLSPPDAAAVAVADSAFKSAIPRHLPVLDRRAHDLPQGAALPTSGLVSSSQMVVFSPLGQIAVAL